MRALLLAVALAACSSHSDQPTPTATPTPTPTANPTPTPQHAPPAPDQTPTPPGSADYATDADCTTTIYGAEPVKNASGCCAALTCVRVETTRRAKELADAWNGACAAVRCRAPDCPPATTDPVPTCKAGLCTSR
jgi:hypothetical protein